MDKVIDGNNSEGGSIQNFKVEETLLLINEFKMTESAYKLNLSFSRLDHTDN